MSEKRLEKEICGAVECDDFAEIASLLDDSRNQVVDQSYNDMFNAVGCTPSQVVALLDSPENLVIDESSDALDITNQLLDELDDVLRQLQSENCIAGKFIIIIIEIKSIIKLYRINARAVYNCKNSRLCIFSQR